MTDERHDRRRRALRFLREWLGHDPNGHVAVSKLYKPAESWSGDTVWGYGVPLRTLDDSTSAVVYLLAEKEDREGFHILEVPTTYLAENLRRLSISKDAIRLHLSARQRDRFVDTRGSGRVPFGQWLVR